MASPVVMSSKPLFLQGADSSFQYNALDMRALIDVPYYSGVDNFNNDFHVIQRIAGTNMSVDVNGGRAVIQGNSPAGSRCYMVADDNEIAANVPLDAAPGSNSRIDLIVIRIRDATVGGGANRDWTIEPVTGTAGASPSPPAVPANCLELARVTVASGTAAISTAMITDRRTCMHRVKDGIGVPAQVINGQIITDILDGTVYHGVDGVFANILAGLAKRANVTGTILGSEPAPTAQLRWESGNQSVPFLAGQGVLALSTLFTTICFATWECISNSTGIVINRRTTGANTPIDGNTIPLFATRNIPSDEFSGTLTVNYFVLGL